MAFLRSNYIYNTEKEKWKIKIELSDLMNSVQMGKHGPVYKGRDRKAFYLFFDFVVDYQNQTNCFR